MYDNVIPLVVLTNSCIFQPNHLIKLPLVSSLLPQLGKITSSLGIFLRGRACSKAFILLASIATLVVLIGPRELASI